jgi:hypothetical protein
MFLERRRMVTICKTKSKGGAPRGNQNARKHGFYSKVLTPQQKDMLSTVSGFSALDREIDVMRVKIASILANDPKNVKVLTLALTSLASLLRTSQRLGSRETRALDTATEVVSRLISENNRA